MKRRHFLQKTTQGLGGLLALPLFAGAAANLPPLPALSGGAIDPRDETYWRLVRDHFPLTRDRIYLNNGGLGPSPYASIEALTRTIAELERICETGHTAELWQTIKTSCAAIMGCDPDEVAYTRNTTEGVNIVCNGLPLKKGDEIITSNHEHVGNTIAWLARWRRDGIRMRVFEPSMASAQENIDRIAKLITPKTRALSLMHISTATGQILPLREIGELARRHNLWYFVDGAQSVGMLPVDVHGIGCHAYATSGHKWLLGPKGTGLLYVRRDMLDTIQAKWVGAYSNTGDYDMRTGEFHYNPSAQRYEYGTVSVPLFVGLGAAVDFLLHIGMENVWARNHALATRLKAGLRTAGAEDLTPQYDTGYSSMITFRIPGVERPALQQFLADQHKLRTRGIYEGGLDGIRISLHIYNSFEEVDRILAAIDDATRKLRG